jgi:hydroxymethylpyrimidine pyrophosphatase-like HAD family hydrolase
MIAIDLDDTLLDSNGAIPERAGARCIPQQQPE